MKVSGYSSTIMPEDCSALCKVYLAFFLFMHTHTQGINSIKPLTLVCRAQNALVFELIVRHFADTAVR